MLSLVINSVVRGENPTSEQFKDLVSNIESEGIFDREPRRFIVSEEKVGKFTVYRTKSIGKGNIVYTVFEHRDISDKDFDLSNKRIGYEIHMSPEGELVRVNKKENPVLFDGCVEVLTTQKRYL